MKILVDEMPKNIEDCPYSIYEPSTWAYSGFYLCSYPGLTGKCDGTDKCPFFMSFDDYKKRTYERTRFTPIID